MKQRLVGTIVLGSLALIIIPLLLDGEGVEPPPLTLNIPPPPRIDTTPVPQPVRPLILGDQAEAALAPTPDSPASDDALALTAAAPEPEVEQEPEPGQQPAPAPEPAQAVAPPSTTPATAPRSETEPARDAQGLPEGWVVRLGVFSERANAEALVSRLLAAGHKAYLEPVTTGQGSMSGVFVGPVLTKREGDALQARLAEGFGEEGLVMQLRIEP